MPDVAAELMEVLEPRRAPIQVALARALERVRGVQVSPSDFDLAGLPPHLRTMFRVEDPGGAVVAEGYDLRALRGDAAPKLRAQLASATAGLERSGLTAWTIGTLPRTVEAAGVTAYPALADEGSSVGVRVLESAAAQAVSHWAGTRRLILLSMSSPARWVTGQLGNAAQLALAAMPEAIDDSIAAAADVLIAAAGGPAWDEAGFARLRGSVAGSLAERTLAIVDQVVRVLAVAREVEQRLEPLTAVPLQPARADVREQLRRLVYPGFVAATGASRLPDLERYLRAAQRRLERLPDAVAVDRDRMNAIHELERLYRERLTATSRPETLREVPWMLEELRVSHFAQALGVKGGASSKRIRRLLDQAA
jgi:ATP-dependent RNA helicase HrpA